MNEHCPSSFARSVFLGAAALLLLSCSGDSGSEPVVASRILLSTTEISFGYLGEEKQITATVLDQGDRPMDGAAVTWASSNVGVAEVSPTGVVTAVSNGEASISASHETLHAAAEVTVQQEVHEVMITPDYLTFSSVGDTASLGVVITDEGGFAISGTEITWTSTDTAVVKVTSSGALTAHGKGSAEVHVESGAATDTAMVVVEQEVMSVDLSPAADTMAAGNALQLNATAYDGNANPVSAAEFNWSVGDTAIALVDTAGLVVGKTTGTTKVVVESNAIADTAEIHVVPGGVASVVLSPDSVSFVSLGDTAALSVSVEDAYGNVIPNPQLTWTSTDSSVVGVDPSNVLIARGNGSAEVRVESGGITDTVAVHVKQVAESLSVEPDNVSLPFGGSAEVTFSAFDANGYAISEVELRSSNTNVGYVEHTGKVAATGVGDAAIVVSAGSLSDTVWIDVHGAGPSGPVLATWEAPVPTGEDIVVIEGTPEAGLWAFGKQGGVLSWSEGQWQLLSQQEWYPAYFAGASFFSSVGYAAVRSPRGNRLLRYEGGQWSTYVENISEPFAVQAVSAEQVILGYSTHVGRFLNGVYAWELSAQVRDMWRAPSGTVFAVTEDARIYRRSEGVWTEDAHPLSGSTTRFRAVHGASDSVVYAISQGLDLLRYDGTTWSRVTHPLAGQDFSFTTLFVQADESLLIASNGGHLLRFSHGEWEAVANFQPSQSLYTLQVAGSDSIFGGGLGGRLVVSVNDAVQNVSAGVSLRGDGLEVVLGQGWRSAGGSVYFTAALYEHSYRSNGNSAALVGSAIVRRSSTGVYSIENESSGGTFTCIWGYGETVLATRDNGSVLVRNPSDGEWSHFAQPFAQPSCVWGYGPDDVIVMANTQLARYDGQSWAEQPIPTPGPRRYHPIAWGPSPDTVFIISDIENVQRLTPDGWTQLSPGHPQGLRSLDGTGDGVLYVGVNNSDYTGRLHTLDGFGWTSYEVRPVRDLKAVADGVIALLTVPDRYQGAVWHGSPGALQHVPTMFDGERGAGRAIVALPGGSLLVTGSWGRALRLDPH